MQTLVSCWDFLYICMKWRGNDLLCCFPMVRGHPCVSFGLHSLYMDALQNILKESTHCKITRNDETRPQGQHHVHHQDPPPRLGVAQTMSPTTCAVSPENSASILPVEYYSTTAASTCTLNVAFADSAPPLPVKPLSSTDTLTSYTPSAHPYNDEHR